MRAIIGEADNGWVVEVPGTVRMIPGHEPQVLSEQATRVAHNGTELVAVIRDLLGFAEGPQVPLVFDEVFMPALGMPGSGDMGFAPERGDAEWAALIEGATARARDRLDRLFGDAEPWLPAAISAKRQQEARPSEEKPGEWLVF